MTITISDYAQDSIFSSFESNNRSARIEELLLKGIEVELENITGMKSRIIKTNKKIKESNQIVQKLKLEDIKLKESLADQIQQLKIKEEKRKTYTF